MNMWKDMYVIIFYNKVGKEFTKMKKYRKLMGFSICGCCLAGLFLFLTYDDIKQVNQAKSATSIDNASKENREFIILDSIEEQVPSATQNNNNFKNEDKPQILPSNPKSPIIIAKLPQTKKSDTVIQTKRKEFRSFEEVEANFNVKAPRYVPTGYKLQKIEYYRPDTKASANAKNDVLQSTYTNGKHELIIIQGYFSGSNVPVGPKGIPSGTTKVQDIKANWVKGTVVYDRESSEKSWDDSLLQLGWNENNIGYRIQATNLNLNELTSIGNDLK